MVTIIFEAHGTTFDNEAHLSSGHNDVAISSLGIKQSKEMGERYKNDHFDAIFCSDLQRAYKSAEIGFGDKWLIIKDARLRECNYGDLTQHPSAEVDIEKPKRISTPFPNGESYEQTTIRIKSFLEDLLNNYDGKRVMIIGHRATQYGLDHLINGVSLEKLTTISGDGPVAIINEGLLPYLNHGEKHKVAAHILNLLKERDGVWITPDIVLWEHLQMFLTLDPTTQKVIEAISGITSRNFETNSFTSNEEARQFFVACGFRIKQYKQRDLVPHLSSVEKVNIEQKKLDAILDRGSLWVMDLK